MQRSFLFVIVTKHTSKIIITMDDSSYRRNFDLDKKKEVHYHSWKNILKWVKLQSLVANCCKMRKI
jgi:hypothetical protein